MAFGSYLAVLPFFVLLATEYFCFGGSFVYDMKTSNVGISFDQHDWDIGAKSFVKSHLNFHLVTSNSVGAGLF